MAIPQIHFFYHVFKTYSFLNLSHLMSTITPIIESSYALFGFLIIRVWHAKPHAPYSPYKPFQKKILHSALPIFDYWKDSFHHTFTFYFIFYVLFVLFIVKNHRIPYSIFYSLEMPTQALSCFSPHGLKLFEYNSPLSSYWKFSESHPSPHL